MLCYKRQGNYVVCNELPFSTVGWVIERETVCLGVRIWKVLFFFTFSKFLSLVSFFLGLGLVLGLDLGLALVLG